MELMEPKPQVALPEPHGPADAPGEPPRDAFRDLVEEHKRTVYALAYDLTGNRHDAEDLSQEVFIRAYRSRSAFRGEAQTSSWLYRIAVNAYLNGRRKKALRFRLLWGDVGVRAVGCDPAPRPDVQAEAEGIQRHLARALRGLSPKERTAFVLRHDHGLALKEVAGVMDVAEGTVKSLLYRATQKLRKTLAFYRSDLGLPPE